VKKTVNPCPFCISYKFNVDGFLVGEYITILRNEGKKKLIQQR
jgi:hypothetical protein